MHHCTSLARTTPSVIAWCFVAVEAIQAHRDLFVDTSSSGLAGPSLRVNGDVPRRASSQSSETSSSPMDYSAASAFGILLAIVLSLL